MLDIVSSSAAGHDGVADKLDLQELVHRFYLALDDKDVGTWLTLWHDDGVLDSPFKAVEGKREIGAFMSQNLHNNRHVCANAVFDLQGDEATARSYQLIFDAQHSAELLASAACHWHFRRYSSGWKIAKMSYRVDPGAKRPAPASET